MDTKQQILKELAALEETVVKLRGVALHAGRQNDLEVAILTEQIKAIREKNSAARDMIDKSILILKKID